MIIVLTFNELIFLREYYKNIVIKRIISIIIIFLPLQFAVVPISWRLVDGIGVDTMLHHLVVLKNE